MKRLLITAALLAYQSLAIAEQPTEITVYRSASCSCCGKWLAHLKDHNFKVQDQVLDNVDAIKQQYAVSAEMASCHTAVVNGYVIEGHVPAADINKLLHLKPQVAGLAVPGMPSGTPGMEMGGHQDAYNVISFNKNHNYDIFNHYDAKP